MLRLLRISKELHTLGVLGINERNANYIGPYNKRANYPLVDDKLNTKRLAIKHGISVPEFFATIEIQHQVPRLASILEPFDDFVIKPARGSGGEGIIVIQEKLKSMYRTIGGRLIPEEALQHHVSGILSGMFSLGGKPDKAIIEYRVKPDKLFEKVSYLGVPDIRTIVFLGVPVMAMVRLPTFFSDGKANLHQGAIGAGIDLKTGRTLKAVCKNSVIEEHPDTGHSVLGIEIPNWRELLTTASKCSDLTGLGYQGVDQVLDQQLGNMMLELNARPGLSIQIANQAGLRPRLDKVLGSAKELATTEEKVEFAMQSF